MDEGKNPVLCCGSQRFSCSIQIVVFKAHINRNNSPLSIDIENPYHRLRQVWVLWVCHCACPFQFVVFMWALAVTYSFVWNAAAADV